MTTLREWLDRLKTIDPDDWGDIEQLRASFSEEELGGDLEAEIAFDTVGGTVGSCGYPIDRQLSGYHR